MRPSSFRTSARIALCASGFVIFLVAACGAFGGAEPDTIDSEQPAASEMTAEFAQPILEPQAEAETFEEPLVHEAPDEIPSSQRPATPDEVFDSSAQGKMVTIDGAATDPAKVEVPREDDPFPNGLSVSWLMPVDGFGMTDLELGRVDHRPRFTDQSRLNITIPFTVSFVDEPQALGLPSELYAIQIETRLAQKIDDMWGFDVAVSPGWFSDFDAGKNNGFRVTGHGMATLRLSDELKLAFGVMYLGRDDVKILPAGGVVTNITPDTQLELVMPKPRLVYFLSKNSDWEQSVYAAFELWGGNTWAVTRPDNSYDHFTYRDFRFILGHELRGPGDDHCIINHQVFEIGYSFARKLEFRNSPETLEPGGTLLLRLASSY